MYNTLIKSPALITLAIRGYIIYKFFVYEKPDPAVVAAMAQCFQDNNWELSAVFRELFKSDHFFLQIRGRRIRLPRLLSPGALVIGHHDLGEGQFAFTLSLRHRVFGEMIAQDAVFQDAKEQHNA